MLKAGIIFSRNVEEKDIAYDCKVSLVPETKNQEEIIKVDKLINVNPNYLEVIDADFEYNGEPYYCAHEFSCIKIQSDDRWLLLKIIDERYRLMLELTKEDNKSLKNNMLLILHNCSVYELKNKEIMIKPSEVTYL